MKKLSLKLVMLAASVFAFAGMNGQVLFDEAFTGNVSSEGFTINQTTGACGWVLGNPAFRGISGAGFDADFAIFDSDDCGGGLNTAELVSPTFDASTVSDIYTLEFDHQHRYCCGGIATVEVFDGSTWNNVYTSTSSVNYPNPAGTESIDISSATGNSAVAQVRFTYSADFAWWWALDNISVTQTAPPTCLDPTGLTPSSVTATSLNADWTSNNTGAGETYNVYVVLDGGTPTTADETGAAAAGANSVAVTTYDGGTPLAPNTDYDLYVEEDCSGAAGGTSALIGPEPFTTPCATEVPDYTEDFDAFVPACWDEATASATPGDPTTGPSGFGSGDWTGRTTYDPSGSAAVNLFNLGTEDWIVSPTFDLSAGGYEVKTEVALTNFFSAAADPDGFTGTDDEVQLLMTEDGVTWTNIATWNAANEPDENGLVESFALASTGSSVQFGFWASEGAVDDGPDYDFHVNEFTVQTPPACPDVTSLMADNYSLTNVDISWTAAAGATSYDWEIQDSPNAQGTPGPVASGSGAATSAAAAGTYVDGNDYILYVNSDCGGPTGNYQSLPFTLVVPPANDDCGGAISLTLGTGACGTPTPGDNTGATDSGIAHTCAAYAGGDIWYSVMVPASGNVTVQSFDTGSPWSDGGMAIYEGTCPGGLVEVDCDDDSGTSAFERITLTGRTPGETLYIAVWEFGNNAFGDMEICAWEPPAPPANDDCAGAEELTVNPDLACGSFASGTLDQATASADGEGCSGTFDNDVWYVFEATATEHEISTFNRVGSSTDMVYQLAEGTCGSLTQLQCHDTPDDGFTATGLTIGNDYYVRVDTWTGTTSDTDFDICVGTSPPPPANDDCATPTSLTPVPWGTPGWTTHSNASATNSGVTSCVGNEDDDIWFSFVAQSENDAVIARGVGIDMVIEIFDGCGGTQLACEDNTLTGDLERSLPGGLTIGNTYYFRVYHYFSGAGGGSVEVQVKTYEDSEVNATYCGNTYDLSQSIYSERDDLGELYANPNVPVKGYRFRFEEDGGPLSVDYASPTETPYITLANVPGLEYGKTYNVSVSHKVRINANGFINDYWSQYGTPCPITIQATVPTTNLVSAFCPSGVDLYLEQQIQAVPVAGASQYRFNFSGPGGPFVEFSNNYAVSLYNVGPNGGPGLQYNSSVYSVTVQALVNGTWSDPGSTCLITMESQPENTGLQNSFCDGTYLADDPNFILAEFVYGAIGYEWQFTPMDGQTAGVQTQITAGISLAFHLADDMDLSEGGDWSVQVRALAEGNNGSFGTACTVTINAGGAIAPPSDDTAEAKFVDVSGIQASLFPNPTNGEQVSIVLSDLTDENQVIQVEVVDFTGKVVHAEQLANKGSKANFIVDFETRLATGMYFVNLYVNDYRIVEKLTVK